MEDFTEALQRRLSNNEQLAARREQAEAEMERAQAEAERAQAELVESRRAQHAALAAHLKAVADELKASRPDRFIVRTGWTESGEEFIAKMSTRKMEPKRSLFIEVDRDDDEVLARWTSEVGNAIEIYRLAEIDEQAITHMVLQVADDHVWSEGRPPAFPDKISPDKISPDKISPDKIS